MAGRVDTSITGDSFAVHLTGRDHAGNSTSVACHFGVAHGFLGFTTPSPGSLVTASAQGAPVRFRLGDYNGTPLTDAAASELVTQVTLSANRKGTNPISTSGCTYRTARNWFRCTLEVPAGVGTYPKEYYLIAHEQLGASFVKSPLVPTSTSPNPQTIFFN